MKHRSAVALFTPLTQYISKINTRYTDRECWTWQACRQDEYVRQLPVHDGTGFLIKAQVCRPLTKATSSGYYLLVSGEDTHDRDNVWAKCTVCSEQEYQESPCGGDRDAVCKPCTVCDKQYEYVKRLGKFDRDIVCAPRTRCTASSERAMYEKTPSVDSTSYYVNGTDAQCAYYSKCGSGYYMSFPGICETYDPRAHARATHNLSS
jgi:hypothetical protein